jgi:hypothetical protein
MTVRCSLIRVFVKLLTFACTKLKLISSFVVVSMPVNFFKTWIQTYPTEDVQLESQYIMYSVQLF